MPENNKEKTILQLAKENQMWRFLGGGSGCNKNRKYDLKDVTCNMCHRLMTVKKWENHPYYCYQCDDLLESVHQDY